MNIRAAEFAVVFLPEKNEANLVLGLKHLGVHSQKKGMRLNNEAK